jgi:hypothetical protein
MDCDLVNVNECDLNSWTFNFGDKVVNDQVQLSHLFTLHNLPNKL